MDLHEKIQRIELGLDIGAEEFQELYEDYSEDTDILSVLAASPHTPLSIKNKIVDTAMGMASGYQPIFWDFVLNNPSTPANILNKMIRKEGIHPNIVLAIIRHPNANSETLEFAVENFIPPPIDFKFSQDSIEERLLESKKLTKKSFDRLFDLFYIRGEIKPANLLTPFLLIGEYSHLLSNYQIDYILSGGMNPSDDINNLRYGLAVSPLVGEGDIGIRLSQVCNHEAALSLAQNKRAPSEALMNIWDITDTVDKAILENPNCPKELREDYINKQRIKSRDRLKREYGENFTIPENYTAKDIVVNKNTDLELLKRLKGYLQ